MGEFSSDDHYIYYCGQESLRRNGVAIMVNKRVRNAVLGCNLKNDRMIAVRFQGKPFNITVIQVYAPTSSAEEAERFYEDLQDLLELTPKSFGGVQFFSIPLAVAGQAPLSMGFFRQEYWSELPFPSPGNLLRDGTCISCIAGGVDPHFSSSSQSVPTWTCSYWAW